jgi:hypothetical protein
MIRGLRLRSLFAEDPARGERIDRGGLDPQPGHTLVKHGTSSMGRPTVRDKNRRSSNSLRYPSHGPAPDATTVTLPGRSFSGLPDAPAALHRAARVRRLRGRDPVLPEGQS